MEKTALSVLGAALAIFGVLAFVLPSPLFGLFEMNPVGASAYFATGGVFLFVGLFTADGCRKIASIAGLLYAGAALVGIFTAPFCNNVLNAGFALVMLYVGFQMKKWQTGGADDE